MNKALVQRTAVILVVAVVAYFVFMVVVKGKRADTTGQSLRDLGPKNWALGVGGAGLLAWLTR